MDRKELQKEADSLLRLVALLFGSISWGAATAAILTVLSPFIDPALPVAFSLQILAGAAGAGLSLWRTS
nr:hypothetical protein [uncultured Shinella sp.]